MRIIAGKHRGRAIAAPAGDAVRPTSDRAREALFNILAHGQFAADAPAYAGASVLDAFAGTGALGLEALSRGAAEVVFIENSRDALAVLRRNLATLGETERARIVAADATAPPRAAAPCSLAFLDPPYGSGSGARALAALGSAGWLAPEALAILEIGKKEHFETPASFALTLERRYGAARLLFLRFGDLTAQRG
ncbi:MAG: 16S rRNA (guanine(966)-N(2))-methyltransferase RsmD [Alphaproteobacteria bacterium]|nr:16S rRNA (guanine(966)-N(2))-methyltransferase RsmD [Alphaproteobacteria bacterium]